MVLPVSPSMLRVVKHLEKFDPSGHPSEAVNEPSGTGPFSRKRTHRTQRAELNRSNRLNELNGTESGMERGVNSALLASATSLIGLHAEPLAVRAGLPGSESTLGEAASDLRSSRSALVM